MACDKKYLKNQKECNVTFILSAAAAAGANEVWLSDYWLPSGNGQSHRQCQGFGQGDEC